jgi:gamma-glutamyltranspeptidase
MKRSVDIKTWREARLCNIGGDQYLLQRDKRATVLFLAANEDSAIKLSRNIHGIGQGLTVQGRII